MQESNVTVVRNNEGSCSILSRYEAGFVSRRMDGYDKRYRQSDKCERRGVRARRRVHL